MMAAESKYPDGNTFTLSELSGAYTDVDDDPDSPDGLWLTASGNNVNTSVLASFPTPTGNPTVGANLQEFRVLVRQYDEGQGGTPEARIELWENGGLIGAGSDTNVPQGGVVLSFTWNANELGTADGSLVECKVVGTKSGGSPSNRNTVEVGAIEWNVDYTVASDFEYTGSGSFTFSGTAVQVYTCNYLYTCSGTFVYSGTASQTYTRNYLYVASGQLTYSGSATVVIGFIYAGSGTLLYSGVAVYSYTFIFVYVSSGACAFSGAATLSYTKIFLYATSGQFVYSGSADYSYEGAGNGDRHTSLVVLN